MCSIITLFVITSVLRSCFGDMDKSRKCDKEITVKEKNMVTLDISIGKHINHAWCANAVTKVFLDMKKASNGNDMTTTILGNDSNDGSFECKVLFAKDIPTETGEKALYYLSHYFYYLNCTLNVVVERAMTLTVSSDFAFAEAKTNEINIFYYKRGESVSAECKKDWVSNKHLTYGIIQLKMYYYDNVLHAYEENTTNAKVVQSLKFVPNINEYTVNCTYLSNAGLRSAAQVILKLEPDLPPTILINGKQPVNHSRSEDDYIYEGTIGSSFSMECTNRESKGTVHWETCQTAVRTKKCVPSKKEADKSLKTSLQLDVKKNNTAYFCVYTNPFGSEKTAVVTINIIKAPKLSASKYKLTPYNKSTSDVFTLHGIAGVFVKIECERGETDGSLHWRYCNKGKCIPTQYTPTQNISRTLTLATASNGATLHCDYLSFYGSEVSTSIIFEIEREAEPEAVIPIRVDRVATNFTVEPEQFQYNEEVIFTCSTEDLDRYVKIILVTPGGEILLPLHKETIPNTKHVFTGRYKLNFTEDVLSRCEARLSEDNRKMGSLERRVKFTKPEEDTGSIVSNDNGKAGSESEAEPDGFPILIWGLLGGGVCILAILIFAVFKTCRRQKQETKMERTSVTYENFNNESQAPTPPFPRTAKLEETYLRPADYKLSKMADAETYAEPYNPQTVEELYSQPLPKNQRIQNLYSKVLPKDQRSKNTVIEGNYAEILTAATPKRNIVNEEGNYASIVSDDSLTDQKYENISKAASIAKAAKSIKDRRDGNYVNVKDENYTNVYLNEPYVNARNSNSEYAEPSYCELGKKH